MIFRVPDDYQGSFILSSLNKALHAGMTISISGNKITAPDVKAAISQKILIPQEKEEYQSKYASVDNEAMIVNLTDKVLVLGDVVLRPWASLLVDKETIETGPFYSASKNGLIHIISDQVSYVDEKVQEVLEQAQKKNAEEAEAEVEETEETEETKEPEKEKFVMGQDRAVKPMVWDFQTQEGKEAEFVPKSPDITMVDEQEQEEVDFIDKEDEEEEEPPKAVAQKKAAKKKTTKKKTAKKKTTKKKTTKKKVAVKKEETPVEKENVKAEEPPKKVEAKKKEPKKAGDELQHLIDALNAPDIDFIDNDGKTDDVSFVDDEQKEEAIRRRQER